MTSSNFYVPGVDGIVFGFDHGFTTPLGYFDQRNPKALLMTEDGETKRRVPAGAPLSVSLSELLDLAGVGSLDDDNVAGEVAESIGTPLFRMTGLLLEINIFYTNLMLLDESKHKKGTLGVSSISYLFKNSSKSKFLEDCARNSAAWRSRILSTLLALA